MYVFLWKKTGKIIFELSSISPLIRSSELWVAGGVANSIDVDQTASGTVWYGSELLYI